MVNPTTSPKAMSASGLCSKSVMRTPGPTVLQRTVGQYSRTVYTNTVMVARLVPPIRGTLPSKVYSSTGTVQKHDTTVPTTTTTTSTSTALALGHAVEKLQLCDSATTKLPPAKTQELDDQSPTKQILKFNNNNKDLTMKTNTPTTTPTRPKKAKPVNTETFDDINDVPATLGSSPVPEGTPTHPFLYHGALAYGSPKKSKLANIMFPTTPTSGDDQKIKKDPNITKKKRTFSNKSGATNDDDIDTILEEFRDLDSTVITTEMDKKTSKKPKHHHHQEEEEEEEEETNVSMPTEETTNVTKDPTITTTAAVDRPSTNIASCPDPTIPTFAAYPMSDEAFQTPPKRRLFIFPRRVEDDPARHQDERPTDTTTQSVVPLLSNNQDDDRKPAALPFFRIPTLIWSKSKQLLTRSPNAAELTTQTNDLNTTTDTTTTMDNTTTMMDTTTKGQPKTVYTSPFKKLQSILKNTRDHACSKINLTWPPKRSSPHALERNPEGVTYNLPRLVETLVEHDDSQGLQTLHQDLLSLVEALEDLHRNPEKEPPKGTQKKLLLFRHFLRNLPENYGNGDLDTLKTALRLVSTALTAVSPAEAPEEDTPTDPILETFESRRDESEVLDVGTLQNSETDNPPESLRSLDTCHPQNLLAHLESALQPYQNRPDVIDENHDVIIPGYDDVDENISLPPSSSSESYTPRSNTANTPRCFSDLSTPRYPFCSPAYSYCSPVRSTDVSPSPGTPSPTTGASPPYHRRDTTVYLTTVVKTDTGLNLPHLAHCTLSNTNPTSSHATLHDEAQHPVPIKLEDLPDEDNPEINTGINYYSDSNNLPSNDNSFAYPVSPPFHSHDDEGHFAMLCMEENKSFDDDQPNNLLSANEAQEEDLPSEYQPPARMLPSLFPDPPYRPDDNLSEIHLNPFRMFQEEDYNAPAELSFPDAILHDDKNGPIRLRDLPICVNTSITIASFCLNYLDAPPAVNYIRDINRHHLFWYFYSINNRSLQITRAPYHMGRPLSDILSVECMTHTLNRATYLLLAHLRSPQRELFPQNLPSSFNDLDDDQSEIMSKCATAFIYALRMMYLVHHRNYNTLGYPKHLFYPGNLHEIARDINSLAAALSLFPKSTTFQKLPYFIQDTFQEDIDQFPMPPDELTHHQLEDLRSNVTHIDSQLRAAHPFTTAFVNTFDTHADTQATALHIAQDFIRFAILQHGMAHHKICISRDPEFSQYEIIVGNLPPADHLLTAFSVSFPMVTKPSDVQLATSYSTDTALAINFVVCKPFNITTIMNLQYHDPLRYIDALQTVTPIATNSANDSIDFLPHSEYILFRVVQLIDPKDPTGILPKNCPPSHGVIFQGSPLCGPTYSYGSPTEMAIPTARAGIFPVTLDHDQQPIIIDPDGNPYTKESVKSLFYKQAAKPLQTYNLDDPDWIQHNPAELWRNEHSQMYHIARDPTKIPFSLAIRLIPVYTISPFGNNVYQAWALPHLNDALRDPELQLFNNHLSYFYREKHNHPEYPYIDSRGPDSPINLDGTGESSPPQLNYPGYFTGDLPISMHDSNFCPNAQDLAESQPVIKFQEDKNTFTGTHHAFLAVQTRRSSLNQPPTRTPDLQHEIPAQNDTAREFSTQNDTTTAEIPPETALSDEETTYEEQVQETQSLPGTQQNLAILAQNSPETDTSHTETPSRSPQSANATPGPLQRISDAFSSIITPKNAKTPHVPATTDSNPNHPVLTTFSTATENIRSKNTSPTDSNPVQQNPSLNPSLLPKHEDEILQPSKMSIPKSTQNPSMTGNKSTKMTKTQNLESRQQTPRPATHATFSYPPTIETFFDNDTDHDSEEDPKQLKPTSPDVLTSSTRTDFTYPPIEDLTKTLLKYAKNANLRKLAYPTDLQARRRHFNTFMDNLRIVCNISPWTRQVFDLWPQQVCYSHPFVGTALYNLIFTNISEPCQKHIIDGPPDARTALFTLRRHCAPLTPDHIERTREAFCSIKQPHNEVATSYLNRIRTISRDCYHAGIPNSDAELIKRTVRGGSNHSFYAASYQRFDADIRRAELNDEALPQFSKLESHLLNIDESRGLTIPSMSHRHFNQHANSARQTTFRPQQGTPVRNFTQRQQQAFSSILRPYTNNGGNNPTRQQHRQHRGPPLPNAQRQTPQNTNNHRRTNAPSTRPSTQQQRTNRPPLRQLPNSNHRPSTNGNTNNQNRNQSNAANIVCNNCGRLGHYSRNCTNPARNATSNRGPSSRSSSNNENSAPRNQQRAYFITDSGENMQENVYHQAFRASSLDPMDDTPDSIPWPNPALPQMEINQHLLDQDFQPSGNHSPPNSGATYYFPDDPQSPHQRFGPPLLENWLPDSGATSHYTPVFSDLHDVTPCSVPVSLADGSTKLSTYKGTTECPFTTDDGMKSILGLTDVYYVEGLSHRLLSLTALSCTQNFSVLIHNRATTIQLPNNSTYTWPILRRELPPHQAFSAISLPNVNLESDSSPAEDHFADTVDTINPDQRRSVTTLPLELVARRLAYRNFRNLMVGSLHQTWNDHVLSPTIDPNTWPLRISISQKRARNKTPQREGTDPFHRLHLDLMRNPFRYGLTTNTNYSAYLFIVTTPGKLTGWIGLPTESTASIITALKSWLTQTELLGRTQSVRFIRTDAGTAFTSAKFITECTNLGIKVEAAAPEHQEMNGICEAKWREVHNTANTLLNNARLGGAFFHHAHAYAVHIINVCPAKNVTDINGIPTTPYQFSYKRKPNLGNFRIFGCPTFFKRYEPTFRNKIITYKQQLQRASRGIFLGFPENSAGWLIYSPDQPQSLIITRDAYFDEDFNSALCFDSKPFAGAVPIRSHFNPNGLRNTAENSEPATFHQTGSAADLGNPPSHFLDASELPTSLVALPDASHIDNQHGPTPPTPHQVNYIGHQHCHSNLQKMMTLYFQECNEDPPSIDPIHTAMLTIDNATISQEEPAEPVDKYLPEPQSLKAVLKLDDDIRSAWLHAIRMEIKNLIDHGTFILGQTPSQADPIIPVKLVLKAKQTATGKLEKLKARLVARGDLEKRLLKKAKAAHQQHLLQQRQEIANAIASATPKVQPIEIPQPFEDTWSPCASSRGVKLLLSTICASRRTLKSADFIGAYLQAKVIGRHFVKLPLEYAFHFPEYAKFFGKPLLLDKGIYGLVYSGKYWNIEFSEWLYSQGFIQSQSEPSYFVRYDKHNQWLRLLFFVDDMLYAGSNDSIEKQFEDSVKNRFDIKFLGPAQWFLQMRIHQHQDSTYTLDQHRYVLNTLQRYDPNSEFPERDTPFPPDYTFSKENRPVTEQDIALVAQKQQRLPFRSAVCTLLYLAYNTRADILFAVCKLAKACIAPGILDFRALTWLIGYLRRRPYYALKFYPDCTSNPIYEICLQHRIPYADLTVFSDASWQDCPDTGRSTIGYMIFHNGALIEANSTMPTPVAMSTSEAEYMAACSATMATAHIRMLLYDMLYLGTKQWRESTQRLPTTPAILMIDNEATVQIAKNGKLTRKTRHIERRFHFVRQGQQDGIHQLHWIPCDYQLADILTKTQLSGKIDPHLKKIFCILPDHMLSSPTLGPEI